jgi:hypothetical protein
MTLHLTTAPERATLGLSRYAPGLHFEVAQRGRPGVERPLHGVPLFVGYGSTRSAASRRLPPALDVSSREHLRACFDVPDRGYLSRAIQGFFDNGGSLCAVHVVAPDEGPAGLARAFEPRGPLEQVAGIDLVCVPDTFMEPDDGAATANRVQAKLLEHCELMGDRFALLDAVPMKSRAGLDPLEAQAGDLRSPFGALYFPWLQVEPATASRPALCVPPCGHIAGVYARTDARIGVHKAPANEAVDGVLATQWTLDDAEHRALNDAGVNCIRNLGGRGIRIWGARTLSGHSKWRYVPSARVYLALSRWLQQNLIDVAFESHTPELWRRVEQRIGAYCRNLFDFGALAGRDPASSYYVKCDAELNPPDSRDAGRLIAEVGLAISVPAEFVVVRIVHDASGHVLIRP